MSGYSASKAMVRSFARTWTTELKSAEITISRGQIDTPIFDPGKGDSLTKMKVDNSVPLGGLGDADEIDKVVSFLASDEAR
jgi:NAD(P)-dependent dehydrogenase (short-subunit alcohol dehydrogenase family)